MGSRDFDLDCVTWIGPPISDSTILARCPKELRSLLEQVDGCIQFHGGFHIRGACKRPVWHSLRNAWNGKQSIHALYPEVAKEDIPFAEDFAGDQYLLRHDSVIVLRAETAQVETTGLPLFDFLEAAQTNPEQFLTLPQNSKFVTGEIALEPGELLGVWPPFCTSYDESTYKTWPQPAIRHRLFLAALAKEIRGIPDGGTFHCAKFLAAHPLRK